MPQWSLWLAGVKKCVNEAVTLSCYTRVAKLRSYCCQNGEHMMGPDSEGRALVMRKNLKQFVTFCVLLAMGGISANAETDNGSTLRVLSYNINGLPAPLASNKTPHFERIAEVLKERRADNTHPHIVVLQEAFDSDTRVIPEVAGYPYVLFGPGRKDSSKRGNVHWAQKTRKSYVSFSNPQKFTGSGLVVMSDYPIVEARHKAFNSDECAGIDCLSNKAILLARVAVPGFAEPFDIVTAHFNSLNSAKAPERTVRKAFEKQTKVMDWFLGKLCQRNPLLVAGDLNTKHADRYAYFRKYVGLADAGEDCLLSGAGCRIETGVTNQMVWKGTNDKHFYRSSNQVALMPSFIDRPFDETLNGKPLSDHRGYEVHYKLTKLAETLKMEALE